jgi:protocatechuate 3,4-dioxygenase beta subunit
MVNNKIIDTEASVTEVTLAALANTADPRLKQIVGALVEHAHALIREVDLTEEELHAGLRFLGALGQANTDTHNEVILCADVLGISTLVALRNNRQQDGQTPPALLGPFWRLHAPDCAAGDSIARIGTPGATMLVSGQVRDVHGQPLAHALVDVWQASPKGLYENQDPDQESMNLRGKFRTDAAGRYHFRTVRPAGYPVPTHGPVGVMLAAQQRHPYRPAHIHFMVSHPAHKTLITQVFSDDSEHLASDVAFGVTQSLVGHFTERRERDASPSDVTMPYFTVEFDFVLEPGRSDFPQPPIK